MSFNKANEGFGDDVYDTAAAAADQPAVLDRQSSQISTSDKNTDIHLSNKEKTASPTGQTLPNIPIAGSDSEGQQLVVDKDLLIRCLQQQVSQLSLQVQSLQKQLLEAEQKQGGSCVSSSKLALLPASSTTRLSHPSKSKPARPHGNTKTTSSPSINSDTSIVTISTDSNTLPVVSEDHVLPSSLSTNDLVSDSMSEQQQKELQATEFKRKISNIGGVSMFGGGGASLGSLNFNPAAARSSLRASTSSRHSESVTVPPTSSSSQLMAGSPRLSTASSSNNNNSPSSSPSTASALTSEAQVALKTWIASQIFSKSDQEDQRSALFKDLESDFNSALKDGQVACKLVNALRPSALIKINTGKFPIMQIENINSFLKAAKDLGVPPQSLFSVADLFEAGDIPKVLQCLSSIKKIQDTSSPK